ncbi:RDD family protein [Flavobacteriaceae bacterium 3-367]
MNPNQPNSELKTEPHLGNRILAGLIDYIIIYGFFFIYGYMFGEPDGEGGFTLNGLPAVVPVLFWALMTVGLEQSLGATLGNSLVGLKPISIKKEVDTPTWGNHTDKPSFGQSLKRHLMDPIDMFFFGLVGIVTIKNTPLNQRVGDLWAKTVVIRAVEK